MRTNTRTQQMIFSILQGSINFSLKPKPSVIDQLTESSTRLLLFFSSVETHPLPGPRFRRPYSWARVTDFSRTRGPQHFVGGGWSLRQFGKLKGIARKRRYRGRRTEPGSSERMTGFRTAEGSVEGRTFDGTVNISVDTDSKGCCWNIASLHVADGLEQTYSGQGSLTSARLRGVSNMRVLWGLGGGLV